MKALISPIEIIYDQSGNELGMRVVEKHESGFAVADPLFWVDCEYNMVPEKCVYNDGIKTVVVENNDTSNVKYATIDILTEI